MDNTGKDRAELLEQAISRMEALEKEMLEMKDLIKGLTKEQAKEERNEKMLQFKEGAKSVITQVGSKIAIVPKVLMPKIAAFYLKAKAAVMAQFGKINDSYVEKQIEKMEKKAEKEALKEAEMAEKLQQKEEKARISAEKANFKAALREEQMAELKQKFDDVKEIVSEKVEQVKQTFLKIKEGTKAKVTSDKCKTAIAPKYIISEIRKNFVKGKLAVAKFISSIQDKMIAKQVEKIEKEMEEEAIREAEKAEENQRREEEARIKQEKADFKAALRDKQKQVIVGKVNAAKEFAKDKFEQVKGAAAEKIGAVKEAYEQSQEQKMADRLQKEEEQRRVAEAKADFKAALREEKLRLREEKKQQIQAQICKTAILPRTLLSKAQLKWAELKVAVAGKYNQFEEFLADKREERAEAQEQKMADRLQKEEEQKRIAEAKADFKAAMAEEKAEQKEAHKLQVKQAREARKLQQAFMKQQRYEQMESLIEENRIERDRLQAEYEELVQSITANAGRGR